MCLVNTKPSSFTQLPTYSISGRYSWSYTTNNTQFMCNCTCSRLKNYADSRRAVCERSFVIKLDISGGVTVETTRPCRTERVHGAKRSSGQTPRAGGYAYRKTCLTLTLWLNQLLTHTPKQQELLGSVLDNESSHQNVLLDVIWRFWIIGPTQSHNESITVGMFIYARPKSSLWRFLSIY